MADPGDVIDRNEERLARIAKGQAAQVVRSRQRQRTRSRLGGKLKRMALAQVAIWAALLVWGLVIGPIGTSALLLVVLVNVLILFALARYPQPEQVAAATLADAPPAALPARTELWLAGQRRQLPQLAAPSVDAISARLATLEMQLAAVPAADPVAQDIGRLLGRHLPELVERYTRVPAEQRTRTIEADGKTLETTLVDGLKVVEAELARASDQLSAADRDALVYQGKFLENRYKGEGV